MVTGTRGCVSIGNTTRTKLMGQDAQGFILTTVLFTQHMWTLAIAIATFLLLASLFTGA